MPLLIPSTGECSTEEGRGWERGWGGKIPRYRCSMSRACQQLRERQCSCQLVLCHDAQTVSKLALQPTTRHLSLTLHALGTLPLLFMTNFIVYARHAAVQLHHLSKHVPQPTRLPKHCFFKPISKIDKSSLPVLR